MHHHILFFIIRKLIMMVSNQVYHHGTLPVDYLYFVANTYLTTGRLVHSIVDRTLLLVLTDFSLEDPT